jgi:hypothetical protein
MSRSWTSLLALAAVTLATTTSAGAAGSRSPSAESSPMRTDAYLKFLVQYSSQISGSWHRSTAKGTKCGAPTEESGTFSSTLAPGARPLTIVVDRDSGHIHVRWPNEEPRGKVNASRTAEGWYTKGGCDPYPPQALEHIPLDNSGCRTRSFATVVSLRPLSGQYEDRGPTRMLLDWQRGPTTSLHCNSGTYEDGGDGANAGSWLERTAQPLNWTTLYRCGVRNPKGCRMTIGTTRTFSEQKEWTRADFGYPEREGIWVEAATVRIKWSVTFVAVGSSRQ